ncbi:PE family protein [Mycobacterium haemophilum]|uniref:PE domain-containing protein n=1 Tax=Mycobacterium haemophilum TaxID=29311 RepID=A0A0I9THX3_9MYCO|nr:PE family protein [Mycobacterium haemophilum]KLO29236.1 hypothetical protein ABH39_12960 [Mycobacterium haemophilum]KLO35840.1 hypothetical protein ABH38_14800 [Mycobacterium haemophilum]KLO41361.1 hypothetical protein ABH37_14100 [Mycobacterium haemophilum]KLO49242.1 hypothetical protein ABH36_13905 [Mycobacterium haemophilum]
MSFVIGVSVAPEALTTVANALRGIGDRMVAEGVAADQVTAAVIAPGGDDVSVQVAARLRDQAAGYRRVSGRAAVNFAEFVASLSGSAAAYSTTETDNATRTG